MKTLIWNGSPHPDGDTAGLLAELKAHLRGEWRQIDAYTAAIGPCRDCRYCLTRDGCAQRDGMQSVYDYIQACDCVVIAAPLYFSTLPGPLLSLGSRLQTYFCARHFRGAEPIAKGKRGGVVLVGGGDGSMARAYEAACSLLHMMRARDIAPWVESHHTDRLPAAKDAAALAGVRALARFLNGELSADGSAAGGRSNGALAAGGLVPLGPAQRPAVEAFLLKHWFSTKMAIRGRLVDLSDAPGFACFEGEEIVGLATYIIEGAVCELTSLDSLRPGRGLGGRLLAAVEEAARDAGCARLQLVTTNDNLEALRFYQKRGFELAGVDLGAVDRARAQKPSIPLTGEHGIPLKHEISFAKALAPAKGGKTRL